MTAGDVMDTAAEFLNDTAKSFYPYSAQLPHLKSALRKYAMRLQDAGIPTIKEISAVIDVAANAATVTLPSDLIQPISLAERSDGSTALFTDVDNISDIPEIDPIAEIKYWTWREETVTINPPTTPREVKLKYWKGLVSITDQTTSIPYIHSQEFLSFRTAALCARFIGENTQRANELDAEAEAALQLAIGLEIKAKQNLPVRPRGYGDSARLAGGISVVIGS